MYQMVVRRVPFFLNIYYVPTYLTVHSVLCTYCVDDRKTKPPVYVDDNRTQPTWVG